MQLHPKFERCETQVSYKLSPFQRRNGTKCLSKLYGSLVRTLSASFSNSKTKRNRWSPTCWISKLLRVFQTALKVWPIASTLSTLLFRNFTAKTTLLLSKVCYFFSSLTRSPSLSESENLLQPSRMRSMVREWTRTPRIEDEVPAEDQPRNCFPTPKKRPTSPTCNRVIRGEVLSLRGR